MIDPDSWRWIRLITCSFPFLTFLLHRGRSWVSVTTPLVSGAWLHTVNASVGFLNVVLAPGSWAMVVCPPATILYHWKEVSHALKGPAFLPVRAQNGT